MKICSISHRIGKELENMGHEVLSLWPSEPLFDLGGHLQAQGFMPDLIFQEENLGRKILLRGLENYSCPKIYWSLDTHLNLYWQSHYFRLFDGLLSPHGSILRKELGPGHPPQRGLAMFGYERPWKPFAERSRKLGFVGRITPQRPVRGWLVEFLENQYRASAVQDLDFPAMLEYYGDTWLAPNESLLGEVNFRLLEAASCGCLVLSQDVGEDQDSLFQSSSEIETYSHVLELKGLIDHYLARPDEAERLGRAAWERVRSEHLIRHRCQSLLDFAQGLPGLRISNSERAAAWLLSLAQLSRSGALEVNSTEMGRTLRSLDETPELAAFLAVWLAEQSPKPEAMDHLFGLLARNRHEDQFIVNFQASLAALILGEFALAKQFLLRQARTGKIKSANAGTPAELCLCWAKESAGFRLGPRGFPFEPGRHVPGSALECLYLAQLHEPENLEITRRLDVLTAALGGRDLIRLGHVSQLWLHNRADWRCAMQLGMLELKTFRLAQGLDDLRLARETALAQGKLESFLRALSVFDPQGRIRAALGRLAAS